MRWCENEGVGGILREFVEYVVMGDDEWLVMRGVRKVRF